MESGYTCMETQMTTRPSGAYKAAKAKAKARTGPAPRRTTRPASPKQAANCCGVLDDLLKPELFKALCDPTRARLVGCLVKCGRPCSVGEVAECCDVDLSVVSRHLKQLAGAGVLTQARCGRVVSYAVRFSEVCNMLRALADAIEEHQPCPGECLVSDGCCGQTGSCAKEPSKRIRNVNIRK